jgi:Flp pilus assembly pilin Flp
LPSTSRRPLRQLGIAHRTDLDREIDVGGRTINPGEILFQDFARGLSATKVAQSAHAQFLTIGLYSKQVFSASLYAEQPKGPGCFRSSGVCPADESGATAIEYALICAGISLLILAAVRTTGAEFVALLTQLVTLWPA